jgi:hypothetical protein
VKLRDDLTLVLGIVVLILAIVFHLRPGFLIVIALLLALRYGTILQKRKRAEILREVPRRPLGLSDDPHESE